MKIIPPLTITDATLAASNVTEADYPEWSAGSYSIGTRRIVTTPDVHKIYESLVNSNTTNPVTDNTAPNTGANWLDLGATNRWKMFDTVNGTQTVRAANIDVTIEQGANVNAVAVLNIAGQTVQVIVDDPVEGEVYNQTRPTTDTVGISDWYAYYFTPIIYLTDIVFLDLPLYPNAAINIIVVNSLDDAAIGALLIGSQVDIGKTLHGTSGGIIDYSVKSTDDFGNFKIIKRGFSKRANYRVFVATNRVSYIQNLLASMRTVPTVWIGNSDFGSTIVYGYYRDFDLVLSSPLSSDCNISVEGLT